MHCLGLCSFSVPFVAFDPTQLRSCVEKRPPLTVKVAVWCLLDGVGGLKQSLHLCIFQGTSAWQSITTNQPSEGMTAASSFLMRMAPNQLKCPQMGLVCILRGDLRSPGEIVDLLLHSTPLLTTSATLAEFCSLEFLPGLVEAFAGHQCKGGTAVLSSSSLRRKCQMICRHRKSLIVTVTLTLQSQMCVSKT